MGNIKMLGVYPNLIQFGSTSTFPSTEHSDFPSDNLLIRHPHRAWHSTVTTVSSVKFDLGSAQEATGCAIVGHNLSSAGTWVLTASNNFDMSSPLYTSASIANTLDTTNLNADLLAVYQKSSLHTFSAITARYWRVALTDGSPITSYLKLGRVMLGLVYQPAKNFDYGMELDVSDKTKVEENEGSGLIIKRTSAYRPRKMKIKFDDQGYGEAMTMYEYIKRTRGKGSDFYIAPFPDDDTHDNAMRSHAEGYYCLTGFGGSVNKYFQGWDSGSLEFTEWL